MNNFQDHTIFNSVNPDALTPTARKPLPFPLENFDSEVADVYVTVDRLYLKLQAAKTNPVNDTPAKQKRLQSLIYKVKTCMKLLKDVSYQCQELWF